MRMSVGRSGVKTHAEAKMVSVVRDTVTVGVSTAV